MKILHQRHPEWLSNTYLVIDDSSAKAFFVDAGGPTDQLEKEIEERNLVVESILLTHHHHDHVQEAERLAGKFGAKIVAHESEKSFLPWIDQMVGHEEKLKVGDLEIKALHIPGHTAGQMAFLLSGETVFTGDTLFKGSIGGNMGPGHSSFEDLRNSIMEVLMKLPMETRILPGHMDETTVRKEWEKNPFIRAFRKLDKVKEVSCTAFGNEAKLLLRAADYDGGAKCWIRLPSGEEVIAPGSHVL